MRSILRCRLRCSLPVGWVVERSSRKVDSREHWECATGRPTAGSDAHRGGCLHLLDARLARVATGGELTGAATGSLRDQGRHAGQAESLRLELVDAMARVRWRRTNPKRRSVRHTQKERHAHGGPGPTGDRRRLARAKLTATARRQRDRAGTEGTRRQGQEDKTIIQIIFISIRTQSLPARSLFVWCVLIVCPSVRRCAGFFRPSTTAAHTRATTGEARRSGEYDLASRTLSVRRSATRPGGQWSTLEPWN